VLQVDQAWGLFKASFAAHNNTPGYYGATELTGHPNDDLGFAVQGALSIKNIPTGVGDVINLQGVYTDGATRYNLQSLAAVNYSMFGGTNLPGAYQSIGFANAPDAVYTGTSVANGTGLENVRTWGFRGGYTHNWDPYWNTGIYGAYAAIQYGNNSKAVICANAVALLALIGTCNPDFNSGRYHHSLDSCEKPDVLGRLRMDPARPEVLWYGRCSDPRSGRQAGRRI
jgi:hypothetical protein